MPPPVTSSTYQPGMIPNQTAFGSTITNLQWIQAFAEYWASRWAHGDRTVPDGWVSAMHGEPDPTDAGGLASPRTLLAFTRYAQQYKPGMDAQTDQTFPWVPPGPNEYVEDPVVTAARIGNEQWQKNFDEQLRQFNITTEEQARQFGLTLDQNERIAMSNAFNAAYQNQLAKFATEAGIFSQQSQNALSLYNTSVGIWDSNEARRVETLGQAGQLSAALQGMYDARGQAAVAYSQNPGDMVARENQVRGIQASKAGEVGVFQNVDTLTEVIRRLIDYKPGDAPVAPTMPNAPVAPVPVGQDPLLANAGNTGDTGYKAYTPPTPVMPGGQTAGSDVIKYPDVIPGYNGPDFSYPTQSVPNMPSAPSKILAPTPGGSATANMPSGYQVIGGQIMRYAYGKTASQGQRGGKLGTAARKMIVGDPQADGQPNPELVQITGDNVKTTVTPLKGTPMGNVAMQPMPMPLPQMRPSALPPSGIRQSPLAMVMAKLNMMNPRTINGVQAFANGTPDVNMPTYSDEAYQNFPSLKYMQGTMGSQQYNTLNTGMAQGAFGTQIPESGAINYRKYLDIARDPISLAALGSLYSSANRNLAAEVARARARAPLGQAMRTNLVRTV